MEIVIGLLVVGAIIWWLARRRGGNGSAPTKPRVPSPRPATQSSHPPPARAEARPTAPPQPRMPETRDTMRFAEPHRSGPLFAYGGPADRRSPGGHVHEGPFAIIDVETTGFSPRHGDRVIEVAVARVDASGRIEDEYVTLVNPDGRDTGAVFIHGISNEAVADAPRFADIAGELLARLDGAVVVAHNAVFEERFLTVEFARAGITTAPLPALCTLWLGQRTFQTPNHKLGTLARYAGIPLVDGHAALGDVRAVARLLPTMLERHGTPIVYGCTPGSGLAAGHTLGTVTPRTRAVQLRKGTDGWMSSLVSRLPMSAADATDADADAYLDALATALEDGKIVGEEAKLLAKLAGSAGLGAAQVAALNERFLERIRETALEDDVVTRDEIRQLTAAAKALGVPDYFDDLTVTEVPSASLTSGTAVEAGTAPAAAATPARKCGHCRTAGHYRSTCPELR